MSTHTPGPWTVREWTCHAKTTVTVPNASYVTGVQVIADCESESDARLIAAAPDMLDALRACVGAIRAASLGDMAALDWLRQADAQARAAIDKAEGK